MRKIASSRPGMLRGALHARRMALELSLISGRCESVLADMTHLGYTILSDADALVTWDESDLARERTRLLVHVYCRRRNLSEPLIGTPLEISSWLDIEIH